MTANPVLDNREAGKVGEFLKRAITPGAQVRAVSAYFSIHAHNHLRAELDAAGSFRFLFGDPQSVANVDPNADTTSFRIREGDLAPHFVLKQKPAAKSCKQWLKNDTVQVRTLKQGFLHGKMYMTDIPNGDGGAALCGSSNFTVRGLGFDGGGNWELNITADDKTRTALREWFDNLWNGNQVCDAKAQVLAELDRLGRDEDPEFVYYLTLYRIFREELDAAQQNESDLRLEESEIWQMLYPFQKDAIGGIIRRLAHHRLCILADSVGLGKTYTALAVMKYYQNSRILVLCPKRLEENWRQFLFFKPNNPLANDGFNYTIHAHTDLGRDNNTVAWEKFDLVIIDESHYFRNSTGARYKELAAALKKSNAKVLMLSATPINTSLKDLRNQILLSAANDAFARDMNIGSVEQLAAVSQRHFVEWAKGNKRDKDELIEKLGGSFLKLMDAITVARSRPHIKKFYTADSGGKLDFPKLDDTETLHPQTDSKGELVYADMYKNIGNFELSIYSPSYYLRQEGEETKHLPGEFSPKDREHYLIGMMRVNFLKRLESSPHAFRLTLARTIDKIRTTESRITRYRNNETIIRQQQTLASIGGAQQQILDDDNTINTADNIPAGEMDEDEDWTVSKRVDYHFSQLRLNDWLEDLQRDREVLETLLEKAERVVPARDAKLAELKRLLQDKIDNPTRNKDGGENRKALLFTSFADTAHYLYDELKPLAEKLGVVIALVVGTGNNKTTHSGGSHKYEDILRHFSPGKQQLQGREIDILIATDCVSEGQNLQDCDYVINYDIHWNPVRIVQRFGRIDRIGSKAARIKMANFWPDIDLDEYLNLKHRVDTRMALVEIGGAGAVAGAEEEKEATKMLEFRNRQLKQLREEKFDPDAIDADGIAMSDFTMADFLAELRAYLLKNKERFDNAPDGLCAVVAADKNKGAHTGTIFCLRHKNSATTQEAQKQNRLHPYYLVYVCEGEGDDAPMVYYSHTSARRSLRLFGELCHGKSDALRELCAAFDTETKNGRDMAKYDAMLHAATKDIIAEFQTGILRGLGADRGAQLPTAAAYPAAAEDFELCSWLVIRDNPQQ